MTVIARFKHVGEIKYGVVEGERVYSLSGDIYGTWEKENTSVLLAEVKLLAPVSPSKIIGVASNYQEVLNKKGQQVPTEPMFFFKPPSAIIGTEAEIVKPAGVEQLAYEAEMAVVLKKGGKNIPLEEALDYVLGYTGANDLTAKDFMTGGPWCKAKGFDTFQPFGPFLVTGEDVNDISVSYTLNGQITQSSTTADMVFKVADIIAYLSGIMTLEAGDVLVTGTPPGAGLLQAGDISEIRVGKAGVLRNKVIAG